MNRVPGTTYLKKRLPMNSTSQLPYACLDDLPYVEYNPQKGEVEIDDEIYNVGTKLREYLRKAHDLFTKLPLPEITLRSIEIKITHPETEDEKGMMEISLFRPKVGEPTCIEQVTRSSSKEVSNEIASKAE